MAAIESIKGALGVIISNNGTAKVALENSSVPWYCTIGLFDFCCRYQKSPVLART